MRKTTVINVMLSKGSGGIEQTAIDYSEAIQSAGHEVYVVIHPKAEIKNKLVAANIKYITLPNMGAWDALAILRLRSLLKKLGANVCITHGNRALSLSRYAVSKECRLVTVMHNYKINCEGVKTVFCPTHDLMRHTEQLGIVKENIIHIPNMVRVKPEFTARPQYQIPVIGSMGRFVEKKGFAILIESLAILKSRHIEFQAMIAGDGEEAASLKALVRSNGLGELVSFLGWIENKQGFFDCTDIFCLPSLHEPFGIVLLEAMAQGLPVISTDSEGPSEIITHGLDGLIVEKANSMALADSLQKLLADKAEASLLGRNAYDTVKNNYDLPVISRKLALVLESL